MAVFTTTKVSEIYEQHLKPTFKYSLHPEQLELVTNALNHPVQGTHSLGILPTGYGKSVCYVLPPLILDQVVVVTNQ